jgi:chromosome condensin MukBEF complex kleisin-like MukF subunit
MFEEAFVPVAYERVQAQAGRSKLLPFRYEKFTLKESKVNGELPDNEFAPENLRLEYGDRMLAEIDGALLVFDKSKKFVPADKFEFDPLSFGNKSFIQAATMLTILSGK